MPDESEPQPTATPEPLAIRQAYVGEDEVPIMLATDFVIQYHRGQFILSIAQMAPPILLGPPQVRLEQAKQIPYVPIRITSRVAMSEERLRALIRVLQGHLERFGKGVPEEEEIEFE